MYYCPLHNWSSYYEQCPACYKHSTSAATNFTIETNHCQSCEDLKSSLKEKDDAYENLEEQFEQMCEHALTAQNQLKEKEKGCDRLKELLSRLEDYFDNRADVNDDDIPGPNVEMCFLSEIRDLL